MTESWWRRRRQAITLAGQALRLWTTRPIMVAVVASIAIGVVVGIVTVLIPNPWFARDIPPQWWNYPVWIATSILTGMLIATYVRPRVPAGADGPTAGLAESDSPGPRLTEDPSETRSARFGTAAGVLAWFAVGCPVCNKIAVVVLGYSGALTWFAPLQPVLAVLALALSAVALVWRLRGQVACAVRG